MGQGGIQSLQRPKKSKRRKTAGQNKNVVFICWLLCFILNLQRKKPWAICLAMNPRSKKCIGIGAGVVAQAV